MLKYKKNLVLISKIYYIEIVKLTAQKIISND